MTKYFVSFLLFTGAAVAHDGNLHPENTVEENMEILKWRTDVLLMFIEDLQTKVHKILELLEDPNDC